MSHKNSLRRHYIHCPELKKLEQLQPELIPEDIRDFRRRTQEKLEKRRQETRKRLQAERDSGSHDPKQLRESLDEECDSFPVAYWPCRHCMLALNSPDKLSEHLVAMHNYTLDEAKN